MRTTANWRVTISTCLAIARAGWAASLPRPLIGNTNDCSCLRALSSCGVNLASGGSSLVTGLMLIDDLSVALSKPQITGLVPQGGGWDLTWDSVPDKTYTVQFGSTVGSLATLATGVASGGLTTTYSDTANHAGNAGFYRVIQE